MSQLSYTPFVDGDQPLAAGFNTRLLLAINLLNSGVESDNIANSAVTASKISSGAVTSSKLSHPILGVQSSNIASATTTDLNTATGNMVDITGTTTITSFGTVQAGAIFFLRFTGILTLTHNATSLILPTGANITTAAGDSAIFESLGSGNWRCSNYQRKDGGALVGGTVSNALSGSVIQTVYTSSGTASSGITTQIPSDNTTPQNTEGVEVLSQSITPNNASNYLLIEAVINYGQSSGPTDGVIAALFQDSTADAIAVCWDGHASSYSGQIVLRHRMVAGTTSSTTFKVRIGADAAITVYMNADSAGNATFNGKMVSSLTIQEIKA